MTFDIFVGSLSVSFIMLVIGLAEFPCGLEKIKIGLPPFQPARESQPRSAFLIIVRKVVCSLLQRGAVDG